MKKLFQKVAEDRKIQHVCDRGPGESLNRNSPILGLDENSSIDTCAVGATHILETAVLPLKNLVGALGQLVTFDHKTPFKFTGKIERGIDQNQIIVWLALVVCPRMWRQSVMLDGDSQLKMIRILILR